MNDYKCPQCNEPIVPEGEYKGTLIYVCPNAHRTAWLDQEKFNEPEN